MTCSDNSPRPGAHGTAALAGLAALTALLALGCQKKTEAAATAVTAAKPARPVLQVDVAPATAAKLPATLELTGSLAADQQSEVAASVPGLVREVRVDVGSVVHKGDVLVRQDERDAALRQAQAAAATAQASARLGVAKPGEAFNPSRVPEVQVARDGLALAETELARAKTLVEGGSAAQSLLDQARARAEQARGQYEAATNSARAAYAAVQAAKAAEDLTHKASNDTDIVAPFDGIVQERRVNPGEFCQVGRVVVLLVRSNPVRVKVDLPEAESALAVVGAEALVRVAAFPDRVFTGRIARVAASLKVQARALPVEIDVPNPDALLKPGFFAHVSLIRPGAPVPVVLVPAAAVGTTGSAARVFVVEGGAVSERIVAVGRSWQGLVEVTGNLQPGENVALAHLDELIDGGKARANPVAGPQLVVPAAAPLPVPAEPARDASAAVAPPVPPTASDKAL